MELMNPRVKQSGEDGFKMRWRSTDVTSRVGK